MILKALIVDDEEHIRNGISQMVASLELDIEVIGKARDTGEGIEITSREKPDIVITDIRMPGEDGLSFCEKLTKIRPQTRVVIISGYDDFEYTKRAIRTGIKEYILKPVNITELKSVLSRIKKEIEEEHILKCRNLEINRKLSKSYDYAKVKFFESIINGTIMDEAELREKESLFEISLEDVELGLVLAHVQASDDILETKWDGDKGLLKYAFINFAEDILVAGQSKIAISPSDYEVLILYALDNNQEYLDLLQMCYELKEASDRLLGTQVLITVGRSKGIRTLSQAYKRLRVLLLNKFLLRECIFDSESFSSSKSSDIQFQWEKKLRTYLEICDSQKVCSLIESIFNLGNGIEFKSAEEIYSVCKKIYMTLNSFTNYGDNEEDDAFDLIGNLLVKSDINELSDELNEEVRLFIDNRSSLNEHGSKMLIRLAIQYINQHYTESISQNEIAEYLNITPQYFSRIFKEHTGSNFIKYITNIKIERAKQLLIEENKKIYEIGENLGYADTKHFIKVFKKISGVTPSEYREKFIDEQHLNTNP
ncbi:response regulator [Petroclostridium sp. X23]|uniref:response regulator n=1 Tax=Petroclostridium sp. X23 TaxID=3045146 RepID=UPI0024AD31B3|nr:response regulator [Petroclostridium sp. X23]WHH57143.1 response regulator [Petroclostridium sp. X23]